MSCIKSRDFFTCEQGQGGNGNEARGQSRHPFLSHRAFLVCELFQKACRSDCDDIYLSGCRISMERGLLSHVSRNTRVANCGAMGVCTMCDNCRALPYVSYEKLPRVVKASNPRDGKPRDQLKKKSR